VEFVSKSFHITHKIFDKFYVHILILNKNILLSELHIEMSISNFDVILKLFLLFIWINKYQNIIKKIKKIKEV